MKFSFGFVFSPKTLKWDLFSDSVNRKPSSEANDESVVYCTLKMVSFYNKTRKKCYHNNNIVLRIKP